MPYPFYRKDEQPQQRTPRTATGVRVVYANDCTHWFPGDQAQALLLARQFCPAELLNHPGTTLDYGERCGTIFIVKQHLSGPTIGPKVSPEDQQQVTSLITPDPF